MKRSSAGPTVLWARSIARKYDFMVASYTRLFRAPMDDLLASIRVPRRRTRTLMGRGCGAQYKRAKPCVGLGRGTTVVVITDQKTPH